MRGREEILSARGPSRALTPSARWREFRTASTYQCSFCISFTAKVFDLVVSADSERYCVLRLVAKYLKSVRGKKGDRVSKSRCHRVQVHYWATHPGTC